MGYHHDVRTTITLDPDVARQLEKEMRRSGKGLKAAVNDALRRAFAAPAAATVPKFVVKARPLGLRPGLDLDNIGELLDQIEGPGHK